MSRQPTKGAPQLAGVTSFGADDTDYIAPPTREIREQAKAGAAALGFVSDKPPQPAEPIAAEAAPAPTAPKKRGRVPSQFPDHYNLRLREGDRERFDDYAYRHRVPKGEAMRRLLDLAEAEERRQAQSGAASKGTSDG